MRECLIMEGSQSAPESWTGESRGQQSLVLWPIYAVTPWVL